MPVNFFHLTSVAADAAEAALNEAPSPVNDQTQHGSLQDPGPGPGRATGDGAGIDGTTEDSVRPTADGAR